MSIQTYLNYIRCDAQSQYNIRAFGYIKNEDHQLVQTCGLSAYLWRGVLASRRLRKLRNSLLAMPGRALENDAAGEDVERT
jgi:hypothetical protein